MRSCWMLAATLLAGIFGAAGAQENAKPHAGMLRYPDVSATHIVFLYANDLWLVPREGGAASPLSSPPGQETFPRFSPDGKTIAFVGNYDGNRDLYILSAEGGVPKRLTHHPASEQLDDWTPDGRLLYETNGFAGLGRQDQLMTVAAQGGLPGKLPIPYGTNGAISPDGRWLAYTPHSTDFRTWKRYRGGMATDIWLFDLKEKKSKKITDWEGTDTLPMWHKTTVYYLSDAGPEHRENLWAYDTQNGRRRQITKFTDWDVKWPSIGPGPQGNGEIVFQYGSGLYLLDLANGRHRAVEVRVPGDKPGIRPHAVDVTRNIQDWSLSPTGKRAVIEARGDIWTAPAKDGSPRNLTRTDGVAERNPTWSPDGRWVACFSDVTGEYELWLLPADGRGESKQLTRGGSAFRYNPVWSPDSKHIAFSDKAGAMHLHAIASGQTKTIDTDPLNIPSPNWSPDSRWIAYGKNEALSRNASIWLYNVETGERKQVTSGMFDDGNPVFDRKGDFLFFASSRSFRPTYEDLGTTWIYADTQVLLAVPLRADVKSPYAPKSDEETVKDAPGDAEKKAETPAVPQAETASDAILIRLEASAAQAQEGDAVSGIWSGTATGDAVGGSIAITFRLTLGANNAVTGSLETPLGNGGITGSYDPAAKELSLTAQIENGPKVVFALKVSGNTLTGTGTAEGRATQIRAERAGGGQAKPGDAAGKSGAAKAPLRVAIDFDGFEARAIPLPVRAGRFGRLAVNDKNQLLYARQGAAGTGEPASIKLFDLNDEKREEKTVVAGSAFDLSADGKKLLVIRGASATIQDAAAGAQGANVVTAGMTATIDPRVEWKQIFHDAWRIQRDFFYDPHMHGVNWKAVHDHYIKMVDDAANREDLSYIISEMIAELNVGHAYYSGGDTQSAPSVSVGMLGADFALENGAYRIARIIQGAPWDVDARGPLGQPGLKVKEGDYLLAVNGAPVDTKKDPWAAFQGMAGQTVMLTVSAKPTLDSSARDVAVRLQSSEGSLRFRDWIERKRAYVAEKTGGRVGYVYVPDTGQNGQNELFRQLVGQRGRDALIIDERWNGGGQIPTRFIELLNRPITNYWARRDGADWPWPFDAHQGPKCMLINGLAGSGGDAFPFYFRQAGLGKLIGTRTWGGLVGISGNPTLIDGGYTSAPTFAFYEKDGTWGIEGHGVDPDIEVVDDPALMTDGGDPQLDAAIRLMLDEIKKSPYRAPKRPPYANRSGFGLDPKDR